MQRNPEHSERPFVVPATIGELEDPDGRGRAASLVCGAFVLITVKVNGERRIEAARFKVAGCSRLVEACGSLCETAQGLSTAEAAKQARSFETHMGAAPAGREHCAGIAGEGLLAAIGNYSDASRAEWNGDDALICTCFGVSEQTIERAVREGRLHSVEAVTETCNAGGGCGSCHVLIQDMLGEVNSEW